MKIDVKRPNVGVARRDEMGGNGKVFILEVNAGRPRWHGTGVGSRGAKRERGGREFTPTVRARDTKGYIHFRQANEA